MASNNSDHRLLFVNHEDTNEELMFPSLIKQDRKPKFVGITQELIYTEISAHGRSIAEINKQVGQRKTVKDSSYARPITTRTTKIVLSEPTISDDTMKTSADPTGRHVTGMLNNGGGLVLLKDR